MMSQREKDSAMKHMQGLYVEAYKGEDVESMLRRLKKRVKRSKMLVEFQERTHYQKPSEVRKRKRHYAKLRTKEEQGREE